MDFFFVVTFPLPMPGKRSKNQVLINVPMERGFLGIIDDFVRNSEFDDRAKFIRAAIVEKLRSMGIEVPNEVARSPSRLGSGGRQRNR